MADFCVYNMPHRFIEIDQFIITAKDIDDCTGNSIFRSIWQKTKVNYYLQVHELNIKSLLSPDKGVIILLYNLLSYNKDSRQKFRLMRETSLKVCCDAHHGIAIHFELTVGPAD